MFCSTCGKELNDSAAVCPGCGCPTRNYQAATGGAGQKNPWIAGILSGLIFGLGQIYLGQIAKGFAAMIIGITLSAITGGVAMLPIGIYLIVDAVKLTNRINGGETIGPWDSWGVK